MKILRQLLLAAVLGMGAGTAAATPVDLPGDAANVQTGGSGYTKTKYPIVLVPGALGFKSMLGFIDYWYKIPAGLRKDGAQVFVTQLSAVNSPMVRGEQLLKQVNQILAITGAQKVNLVGHSIGSPTARYVASLYPGKVASVTSVAGANGPPEFLRHLAGNGDKYTAWAVGVIGFFINWFDNADLPQDGTALMNWNLDGVPAFNAKYPEGLPPANDMCQSGEMIAKNGVYYFSWGGTGVFTNALDPSDYFLQVLAWANRAEENDGPVGRCANHLGQVIRDDYKLNHLDETNLFFGLKAWGAPDPVTLFRVQANRLKQLGL